MSDFPVRIDMSNHPKELSLRQQFKAAVENGLSPALFAVNITGGYAIAVLDQSGGVNQFQTHLVKKIPNNIQQRIIGTQKALSGIWNNGGSIKEGDIMEDARGNWGLGEPNSQAIREMA